MGGPGNDPRSRSADSTSVSRSVDRRRRQQHRSRDGHLPTTGLGDLSPPLCCGRKSCATATRSVQFLCSLCGRVSSYKSTNTITLLTSLRQFVYWTNLRFHHHHHHIRLLEVHASLICKHISLPAGFHGNLPVSNLLSVSVAKNQYFRPCRQNYALDRKMIDTF